MKSLSNLGGHGAMVAVTASVLSACSTVVTTSTPASLTASPSADAVTGVAYALPKGQIQITAQRSPPDPAAMAIASTTLSKASQTLVNDNAALAAAAGATNPDKAKVAAAQAQVDADQLAVNAATSALAAAAAWQESAILTLLPPAADGDARYVANLNHSWLRDDNVQFTISGGLLSSSNIVSTDQTPAIVTSIIETALAQILAGPGGTFVPKAVPEACSPYSFTRVFDPLDPVQVPRVKSDLAALDPNLKLLVDAQESKPHPVQSIGNDAVGGGLVYRIPETVIVRTEPIVSKSCPMPTVMVSQALQATVPDSRSAFVLSTAAGPFTTTNLQYGFSNGMLTSYSAHRPSEIAAAWSIVPDILNTVPQLVAQVFQARVNVDSAKTALVNADAGYAQAKVQTRINLLTAEAQLDNQIAALKQVKIGEATTRDASLIALENARASLAAAIKAAEAATAPTNPPSP